MYLQVVLTFHRPNELRCYETEQAGCILRMTAVAFICWDQWCVSGTVQHKIFAYEEPTISRLFLVFDRGAVIDKLLARDRVHAKISALRRNLTKHALHFAPY